MPWTLLGAFGRFLMFSAKIYQTCADAVTVGEHDSLVWGEPMPPPMIG
jgi:hypothetical protein